MPKRRYLQRLLRGLTATPVLRAEGSKKGLRVHGLRVKLLSPKPERGLNLSVRESKPASLLVPSCGRVFWLSLEPFRCRELREERWRFQAFVPLRFRVLKVFRFWARPWREMDSLQIRSRGFEVDLFRVLVFIERISASRAFAVFGTVCCLSASFWWPWSEMTPLRPCALGLGHVDLWPKPWILPPLSNS